MRGYLLQTDGTWYVHVATIGTPYGVLTIETTSVRLGNGDVVQGAPAQRANWYMFDCADRPHELVLEWKPSIVTDRWELDKPEAAKVLGDWPAVMTDEEFWDLDGDREVIAVRLYRRAERTVRHADTVLSLRDAVVLVGEPAPADGREWHADLPYELRHYPEYLHLFPGHTGKFQPALVKALDNIPGVKAYATSALNAVFTVYGHFPLPKPRRGKGSGRHSIQYQTVEVQLSSRPPSRIDGPNRAAAYAVWDDLLARYVSEVEEFMASDECGHCRGTGRNFKRNEG